MQRENPVTDVIIDFDYTISPVHLHHSIVGLLNEPDNYSRFMQLNNNESTVSDRLQPWTPAAIEFVWQLVKDRNLLSAASTEQGRIAANEWRNIIMNLIDNNYTVSIASFSSFAPIIERYLREVVKIPNEYMNRVNIHAWLPSDQSNKNAHLDRIISRVSPTTEIDLTTQVLPPEVRKRLYENLILIDDSVGNINAVKAIAGDAHAIQVNSGTPAKVYLNPGIVRNELSGTLHLQFSPISPARTAELARPPIEEKAPKHAKVAKFTITLESPNIRPATFTGDSLEDLIIKLKESIYTQPRSHRDGCNIRITKAASSDAEISTESQFSYGLDKSGSRKNMLVLERGPDFVLNDAFANLWGTTQNRLFTSHIPIPDEIIISTARYNFDNFDRRDIDIFSLCLTSRDSHLIDDTLRHQSSIFLHEARKDVSRTLDRSPQRAPILNLYEAIQQERITFTKELSRINQLIRETLQTAGWDDKKANDKKSLDKNPVYQQIVKLLVTLNNLPENIKSGDIQSFDQIKNSLLEQIEACKNAARANQSGHLLAKLPTSFESKLLDKFNNVDNLFITNEASAQLHK